MLLHVWADEDREPPWDGELDLEDAETGQRMELAFDAEARARYTAEFDRYADQLERVALRNSGRYVGLSTSVPIEQAVFGSLVRSGVLTMSNSWANSDVGQVANLRPIANRPCLGSSARRQIGNRPQVGNLST